MPLGSPLIQNPTSRNKFKRSYRVYDCLVGLFRKISKPDFTFLLPDGSDPDSSSKSAVAKSIMSLTIDSDEQSVLHPVDSASWIKASSEIEFSGFRRASDVGATPIAYAQVSIRGTDEDKDVVNGLAILTEAFLTLHWSHRGQQRGFKFFHSDLLGVDVSSGTSTYLHYGASVRKTQNEFLNTGDFTFEITLLPSKDRHENRRSLTFWMSLANHLSRTIPGVKFMELG